MGQRPVPGEFQWGQKLNDHLDVALDAETGAIKESALAAAGVDPGQVAEIQDFVDTAEPTIGGMAYRRFDPTHPDYGATRGTGLSSAQRQANVDAFNNAAADAAAANGILEVRGTFEIEGELVIGCRYVHMQHCAIRQYDADAVTITYGTTTPGAWIEDVWAYLPQVRNMTKTTLGWDETTAIGVVCANLAGGHVFVEEIRNFAVGLDIAAFGWGAVDVNYHLSRLINNKVNFRAAPRDTSGWVNENNFIGGKWQINGGEGQHIEGVRHAVLTRPEDGYNPNKNVFYKPNFEGSGPEYSIDLDGVSQTLFISPRLEASIGYSNNVRVNNASGIMFLHGTGTERFITWSGDSLDEVDVISHAYKALRGDYDGGTLRIANTLGDSIDPHVVICPPEEDGHIDAHGQRYLWRLGTRTLRGRSNADSEDRIRINFANAATAISLGNGTTSSLRTIGLYPSEPEGASTAPQGSIRTTMQGRLFLKVSGTGSTGWKELLPVWAGTTAERPTSGFPTGGSYFDTTLGQPIWFDGTNWVDATGAVV